MPRVSLSTNYLLEPLCSLTDRFDRYYSIPSLIQKNNDEDETSTMLSPSEIDRILSRKLYEQSSRQMIDPELTVLIDRFFNLTYQNTIPMVNLLSTAIATNFLQENLRDLDKKLQEQQINYQPVNIKRGSSLLYEFEKDQDDDDISWASAPT